MNGMVNIDLHYHAIGKQGCRIKDHAYLKAGAIVKYSREVALCNSCGCLFNVCGEIHMTRLGDHAEAEADHVACLILQHVCVHCHWKRVSLSKCCIQWKR